MSTIAINATGKGTRRSRWRYASAVMRFCGTLMITFLGLTAVTFVIGRVVPIDPAVVIVGDRAPIEAYQAARKALNLDEPIMVQYVLYLRDIFQGDFGISLLSGQPVFTDMITLFPATIELATIGVVLGAGPGIPLGIWAAVRQGKFADHVIRTLTLIGYSVPIFWLGLVGLLVFYAKLGWVGGPGRVDIFYQGIVPIRTNMILIDTALAGEWDIFRNAVGHIILPGVLLGYVTLAYVARLTRSLMLDQLKQEYVITARVKGLSETKVIWGHAFRNILVPLITVIALSYALLLEGAVLTETVFAWPGIGLYITNSLFNADINAVLGGTIMIGFAFVTLNLFSDFLYKLADPRLRP